MSFFVVGGGGGTGAGVAGGREKGGEKREGEGHNPKKESLYLPLIENQMVTSILY